MKRLVVLLMIAFLPSLAMPMEILGLRALKKLVAGLSNSICAPVVPATDCNSKNGLPGTDCLNKTDGTDCTHCENNAVEEWCKPKRTKDCSWGPDFACGWRHPAQCAGGACPDPSGPFNFHCSNVTQCD